MANENKITTLGQMRSFAEKQDTRDDLQEERIRQLEEGNDGFLKYTEQALADDQKAQARENIGATTVYFDEEEAANAPVGSFWWDEDEEGGDEPGAYPTGDALPIPETASVGQFIVVSAVDENGKVTATEAVTIPAAEGASF